MSDAFSAYSVAIKLSLVGNAAAGVMALSKHLQGAGNDAKRLEDRMASIGKQLALGGAMLAGGLAIAHMFKAPIDAAKSYELAFTKFKTMNLGESINKQADHFARSANVLGVSSKDLMESLSESVGLFGSFDIAQRLVPTIASLNAANSAIFAGKVGHIDEGSTRALMKFIDRRGGTHDEETFMRNLNLAQRMVTGSGGFIKFRDLEQFSQMGGTAFRGLSDQGILNMALLLQEQGGAKAGTALMSMYQNLVAGRTPKKTMAMLQEFGLGHLAMEKHATVGGKALKSLVMRDVKNADLLQSDPATWIRTTFIPALAKKGITSEAGILKATNDLISNRTASNQASIMSTQVMQLMRDANLTKNAMDVSKTIDVFKKDPNSKFADLQAKWNSLMINLGIAVLPIAIDALELIIPKIIKLSDYIDKNRESVSRFAEGLAYFSGFLIGGGLINLIAGAGRGFALLFTVLSGGGGVTGAIMKGIGFIGNLIMIGLRAIPVIGWILMIVTAAVWVYRNWDLVKAKAKEVWGFIGPYITGIWDSICDFAKTAWGVLSAGFNGFIGFFLDQWQWAFNNLIDMVNAFLPKVAQLKRFDFADRWNRPEASYSNEGRGHNVPVPPKQSTTVQVHTKLQLDSKVLGESVTIHQTREATKPMTGMRGFDAVSSAVLPTMPSSFYPRG